MVQPDSSVFGYALSYEWERGTYTIHFDKDSPIQAKAKVISQGEVTFCPVIWKCFILHQEKLRFLLNQDHSALTPELECVAGRFRVYLSCQKLEMKADKIRKKLSHQNFTNDLKLKLLADWYKEAEDHQERHKFLLNLIERSQRSTEKATAIAATNAASILKAAGFSFYKFPFKEASFHHINLSEAMLVEADLGGAKLKKARLDRTDLSGANLCGSDLRQLSLSQRPYFTHFLSRPQASHPYLPVTMSATYLISADQDLYVWDIERGSLRYTIKGKERISCLEISRDGQRLIMGTEKGKVQVKQLEGNQNVTEAHDYSGYVKQVHLSPQGDVLVTWSSKKIIVYALKESKGKLRLSLLWKVSADSIKAFAYLSIQRQVVFLTEGQLLFYDLKSGKCVRKSLLQRSIRDIRPFPNEDKLLLIGEEKLFQMQIDTEQVIEILEERRRKIHFADVMPDSRSIIYVVDGQTICEYDLQEREERTRFEGGHHTIISFKLSSNGQYLVVGDIEGHLVQWKWKEIEDLKNSLGGEVRGMRFSRKNKEITILINRNKIIRYSLNTGLHLNEDKIDPLLDIDRLMERDNFSIQQCFPAFLRYQPLLVSGGSQKFRRNDQDHFPYQVMALSSTNHLALLTARGSIEIWDIKKSQLCAALPVHTHKGSFNFCQPVMLFSKPLSSRHAILLALALNSPNTAIAPKMMIWELKQDQPFQCLGILEYEDQSLTGASAWINSLAFSEDGLSIFSASTHENAIRQWGILSKRTERVFSGHRAPVVSLDLHSKRHLLLSGCQDRTVCLWNLQTTQKMFEVQTYCMIDRLHFSPDGHYFVVIAEQGKAFYIWKIYDEDDQLNPKLLWKQPHVLECRQTKIDLPKHTHDATGLGQTQRALLKQLGAIEIAN